MDHTDQSQHRAPLHHAAKKANNMKVTLAIIAAVVVIVIGGFTAWALKSGADSTSAAIDSSKFQAVFFTNGQVYFGKLQSFNNDYFKLTNIFYLQASQADAAKQAQSTGGSSNSNNVQLIKLGDEIHGPDDQMVVAKDQILFFENLKADGKVSKSISTYQNPNK